MARTRRTPARLLTSAVLLVALAILVPTAGSAAPFRLALVVRATGLDALTQVTNAGDNSGRIFLVERRGTVRVYQRGALQPGFFLDIRPRVSAGGERGLLGLAFHPSFETNRRLFVFFTRADGDIVIARYTANAARTAVDPATYAPVMLIEHSAASNHNGGGLAFSPRNGYLYIAVGDGGGSGDPENDAQELTSTLLGKILRINVNGTGAGYFGRYSIPASNPFVGRRGHDEIWSYGLRNPWRISFDRVTGNLFIGDVGQARWEEVNREPAASAGGRNYGWRVMEGLHCYAATSCSLAGDTLPVAEYSHNFGKCSITGGHVYRGRTHTALVGYYVYADFCSGRVWTMPHWGGNTDQVLRLTTSHQITSFGESEAGELWAVTIDGTFLQVVVA